MVRPRTPILSRSKIAAAALALVDTEGPEGASIRRVAARLGVHPTSLYNHVPTRDAMIEDIRALVSENIDSSSLREHRWEDGLHAWANSYRNAFARHPRAIPLLMSSAASTPVLLAEYEDFAVAALKVGWDRKEVLPLLTTFESFILGSVLDMSGPAVLFDPRGQEEAFPEFTAAYLSIGGAEPQMSVADRAFELGLAMLVRGARPLGHTD
jgi:AcrR family transcriptional regulator